MTSEDLDAILPVCGGPRWSCGGVIAWILAILTFGWFIRELIASLMPSDYVPQLYYKQSTLARFILCKVPRLREPYRPPVWARNGHVQTMFWLFAPAAEIRVRREYLQMKDRGIVALDWVVDTDSNLHPYSPILLVLPALHQQTGHVSSLLRDARAVGFRPLVFHRRGHAGCPLTNPRLQSFGDPMDLRQVIRFITTRWPRSKIVAVGYSSGASLLLSYLGEFGSSAYLASAVAVSPLWNSEQFFSEALPFPYSWFHLLTLRALLYSHASVLSSGGVNVDSALSTNDLQTLEYMMYGKPAGFQSPDAYWEMNNPLRDIDEVSIPLLCLQSRDDPIYPESLVPYDLPNAYPNFLLATTDKGGHAAFLDDATDGEGSWATAVAIDYLIAMLHFDHFNGEFK